MSSEVPDSPRPTPSPSTSFADSEATKRAWWEQLERRHGDPRPPTLSADARLILQLAHQEAIRSGLAEVTPACLLIGLLKSDDRAAGLLAYRGLTLTAAREWFGRPPPGKDEGERFAWGWDDARPAP